MKYGYDPPPYLTMAELSASPAELADRNTEDVRQILDGPSDHVEEIITASMLRRRRDAFKGLTQKYRILSH